MCCRLIRAVEGDEDSRRLELDSLFLYRFSFSASFAPLQGIAIHLSQLNQPHNPLPHAHLHDTSRISLTHPFKNPLSHWPPLLWMLMTVLSRSDLAGCAGVQERGSIDLPSPAKDVSGPLVVLLQLEPIEDLLGLLDLELHLVLVQFALNLALSKDSPLTCVLPLPRQLG